VNRETLTNESKFRQFLLGEMAEADRLEFEQSFILDEVLFEDLRVAEDELIENYLYSALSETDRQKFETNFLTTAERRQRVALTREMIEKFRAEPAFKKQPAEGKGVSVWANLRALFKQPGIAFGTVLTILTLIGGGWFLLRKADKPVEMVITTSPTVSLSPALPTTANSQVETNLNQPVNKSDNRNLNQPVPNVIKPNTNSEPTPKKNGTQSPVVTTLALFTGGVRGGGKINELNLPPNATGANLELNLESRDYKTYYAEILDQNGKIIYQSGKLTPHGSKVKTLIPAKKLSRGDYIIKLYGKNDKNRDESVADFQFQVNRK
jgi:hypothetical protein